MRIEIQADWGFEPPEEFKRTGTQSDGKTGRQLRRALEALYL